MVPQEGVEGSRPTPRKLNDASVRMACAMEKLATTLTGPIALGNTCRNRTRASLAPTARLMPDREHLGAHDARIVDPGGERQHQHHGNSAATECAQQEDGEQQEREGQLHVDEPAARDL